MISENINTIKYRLNLDIKDTNVYSNQLFKYFVVEEGVPDITIVRNYNPYFIKQLENDTILDIYAGGYNVIEEQSENNFRVIKKETGARYIVGPLERLEDIAQKFSVTKEYIMESNSLNTDKLFVGQILII